MFSKLTIAVVALGLVCVALVLDGVRLRNERRHIEWILEQALEQNIVLSQEKELAINNAVQVPCPTTPTPTALPETIDACSDCDGRVPLSGVLKTPEPKTAQPVRLFGPAPVYKLQLPLSGKKFVLLVGCGASSLGMTQEHWVAISPFVDTWAINNLQWHPTIVPDYWHLEPIGDRIYGTDLPFQSWGQFPTPPVESQERKWVNHTILICEQGCQHLEHMRWTQKMQKRFYRRASISACAPDPPCDPNEARRVPVKDQVHVPCCSTMNRVMDLIVRAGYERVFTIGLDGDTTYYFEDKNIVQTGPCAHTPEIFERVTRIGTSDAFARLAKNTTGMDCYAHESLLTKPKSNSSSANLKHLTIKSGIAEYIAEFARHNKVVIIPLNRKTPSGEWDRVATDHALHSLADEIPHLRWK